MSVIADEVTGILAFLSVLGAIGVSMFGLWYFGKVIKNLMEHFGKLLDQLNKLIEVQAEIVKEKKE